jgi:hypothetical protein
MTPEQFEQINLPAMKLAALPVERRAELFAALGRAYAILYGRAFPHATREEFVENSWAYATAVGHRVMEIDAVSGGPPAGSA